MRLHEVPVRPHPLDGSSVTSSDPMSPREFMALPVMAGDNEPYMRMGMDARYWQGSFMGHESSTAAVAHSFTGKIVI